MKIAAAVLAVAGLASSVVAAPTLTALSTFGTNGWRQPYQVLAGDVAASNDGATTPSYRYLGSSVNTIAPGVSFGGANLERGLAYNPATGNLILVSRSISGNGLRILDGTTGADRGSLNQGTGVISGGTFTTNLTQVDSSGNIYISNLATSGGGTFRVYRTTEGAAAPTLFASQAVSTAQARLGDSLAISRDGSLLAAGHQSPVGFTTLTTGGTPTFTANTVGPAGGYRPGLTFGSSSNEIFGKTLSSAANRSTFNGTNWVSGGSAALTSAGEAPLGAAVIAGTLYLASVDVNNARVYVYDLTNPNSPVSLFPFGVTTTSYNPVTGASDSAPSNGNATGALAWGAIDNVNATATLYVLSSNQGIQALTFTVPAPASAGLLGLGGLVALRRRR